jgi:hypothetical protein
MPITTRTIKKGIPPRLHKPKSKPHPKKPNLKKGRKRDASDDDEEPESDGSELEAKKAKKKASKRRRTESEDDVEVIEDDVQPEQEIEDVDVENGREDEPTDEQEVSSTIHCISLHGLTKL